ncbi:MAG: hypothetical protein QM586_16175 [Xenophilus sp.]
MNATPAGKNKHRASFLRRFLPGCLLAASAAALTGCAVSSLPGFSFLLPQDVQDVYNTKGHPADQLVRMLGKPMRANAADGRFTLWWGFKQSWTEKRWFSTGIPTVVGMGGGTVFYGEPTGSWVDMPFSKACDITAKVANGIVDDIAIDSTGKNKMACAAMIQSLRRQTGH